MIFGGIFQLLDLKVMRFGHVIFGFKVFEIWVGYQFPTQIWISKKGYFGLEKKGKKLTIRVIRFLFYFKELPI